VERRATGRTLTDRSNGWHATGDLVELDSQGFVRIVGRKSDVFKLSTGRAVVPAPIEAALGRLPMVEHAVVLGRGRVRPVAVVAVAPEILARCAVRAGVAPGDGDDLGRYIEGALDEAVDSLPPRDRPAGYVVLSRPLSERAGELTANQKVRRHVVEGRFARELHAIGGEQGRVRWTTIS
jgi:long-chain acyl-CoA synthetase